MFPRWKDPNIYIALHVWLEDWGPKPEPENDSPFPDTIITSQNSEGQSGGIDNPQWTSKQKQGLMESNCGIAPRSFLFV